MPVIAHLAVAHFYAVVERQLDNQLQGQPIAVFKGNVLWDTCPIAAAAGLHPDMTLRQARIACAHTNFLPYEAEKYVPWARRIWDLCAEHTPQVEPESPHSVFLDLAGCTSPGKTLEKLLDQITTLGFHPRAGLAASRLVARIAASLVTASTSAGHPPAPPRIVPSHGEAAFLSRLPLKTLWTLDTALYRRLWELGLYTIGEVARVPRGQLIRQLGPIGRQVHAWSCGLDTTPVRAAWPPPEVRYSWRCLPEEVGCHHGEDLRRLLYQAAEKIAAQLASCGMGCRCLLLEVELDGGTRRQTQMHLGGTVQQSTLLIAAARRMTARLEIANPLRELHLIASELAAVSPIQADLFRPMVRQNQYQLERSCATVRERFGERSLRWGRELSPTRRERLHALLAQFDG